jgi:transposase
MMQLREERLGPARFQNADVSIPGTVNWFGPGNVRSKAQTEGGTGVGQRSLADDVAGSIQHADVMLTVSEVQTEGERTCEAADQLWATLTPEQKAAVEAVAVDMWEPFIQTIERQVPAADIVHDRFHVSKYLNESVDKVRRQEHKELLAEGDETLKGTRQLWLYNPQHFSQKQRDEFSGLKDQQLKVARAWAMKELFSKFWEYQEAGWARRFFKDWFGWVSRSQLKPMADVARLLKRHLENLR